MHLKTISYHIKCSSSERKVLSFLCHISKNIYNCALYRLRQAFFSGSSIPSWFDLNKELRENGNWHLINTFASSCSVRNACASFSVFLANMRKGFRMPGYLPKSGYMPFVTEQIQLREENGKTLIKVPFSNDMRTGRMFSKGYEDPLVTRFISELGMSKVSTLYFPVPKKIKEETIREFRVVPLMGGDSFKAEFVYEYEEERHDLDRSRMMSIDIGMKNLLSCVTSDNRSFLIKGGLLESRLEYFSKRIADAMSRLPKGVHTSKKIRKLFYKSRCFTDDFIDKAVSAVRNRCMTDNIGTLVIGWNDGLKEGGVKNDNLKRKTRKEINRRYCRIPLSKMKEKIRQTFEDIGMEVHIVNESYTSVSSFYDNDSLSCDSPRSGTRLHRGLYVTGKGARINADINGALNILRAYSPDKAEMLMGKGPTHPDGIRIAL